MGRAIQSTEKRGNGGKQGNVQRVERRIVRREPLVQAGSLAGQHPLLSRVLANRGISTQSELDLSLAGLLPPNTLKHSDVAARRLAEAVTRNQRILIVGDFDADGATSTAVALGALQELGATSVDYLVPNRFDYGYGLSREIVELARSKDPDLILTVDNGISSVDGVASANAAGIDVIVSDHHLPGDVLPNAECIVNPNQAGCSFASKHLAGVGVVFYLMLALRAELREQHYFKVSGRQEPPLTNYLDLVALGTVADVVPLDKNNRILVAAGIRRIRKGLANPGVTALLQVAKKEAPTLVASDLGFAIGPRLNAAGRLDDMSLGIECLRTDDPLKAQELALTLDSMNRERQRIEKEMRHDAEHLLEQMSNETLGPGSPAAYVLFEPHWHQGVVGILASRLKDRAERPVFAFADSGDGILKGSGRSIPGLHLRDTLDSIAKTHPGVLQRFGGHAMAAGVSLEAPRLDAFRQAFVETVERSLDDSVRPVVYSDGALDACEFSLDSARLLREAGPWGQGFPEPSFDGVFEILEQRLVGESHLKLKLLHPHNPIVLDAIAFSVDTQHWPDPSINQVRLVFRLDVNFFRGTRSLQLLVEHLSPCRYGDSMEHRTQERVEVSA